MRALLIAALALGVVGCKSRSSSNASPTVEKFGAKVTLPPDAEESKQAADLTLKMAGIICGDMGEPEGASGWTVDRPETMVGIAHQYGQGFGMPRFTQEQPVGAWPAGYKSLRLSKSTVTKDAHITTAISNYTDGKLTAHVKVLGGKSGEAWDVWMVECISKDDSVCVRVLDSFHLVNTAPYLAL